MITQNDVIDKLNDLNHAKTEYEKKLTEFNEIKGNCNHKYGNGESALEGGFFCTTCQICNWSDMGV